jgi:hypothetical protein
MFQLSLVIKQTIIKSIIIFKFLIRQMVNRNKKVNK